MRKKLLWIIGLLVTVMLIAAIILPRLIDLEAYRPTIEQAIERQTGWDATLGEMSLSLFGGAIAVSPVELSAATGSSIQTASVELKARWLPLLQKRIELDAVTLVDPEIVFVRLNEADGWMLPGKQAQARVRGAIQAMPASNEEGGEPSGDGFAVDIATIRVENGTLQLDDRAIDPPRLTRFTAINGSYSPNDGGSRGSLVFGDDGGNASWRGQFGGAVEVTLDSVKSETLHPYLGETLIREGGTLDGTITVESGGTIRGELASNNLTLLSGVRPFDEASLKGTLVPEGDGWTMESIAFTGEGVTVSGSGPLSPDLDLTLQLEPTPIEQAVRGSQAVLPLPLQPTGPGEVQATIEIEQPADGELVYAARGTMSAAAVDPGAPLPSSNDVAASFTLSREGRFDLTIDQSTIAAGAATGRAWIDSLDPPGSLHFEGSLQDAVFGQLLGGFVAQAKEVVGPTGFNASLSVALDQEVLDAAALGGTIEWSASDLQLPGWNLEDAIRKEVEKKLEGGAGGLLDRLLNKDKKKKEETTEEATAPSSTQIDLLRGALSLDAQPWELTTVEMIVGDVSSTGSGSFDPVSGAIKLRLQARLSAERTQALFGNDRLLRKLIDSEGRMTLPIRVGGTMMAPKVDVDSSAALKGLFD